MGQLKCGLESLIGWEPWLGTFISSVSSKIVTDMVLVI